MAYTHYFPQADFPTKEAWAAFMADAQKVLDFIQDDREILLAAMQPYDQTEEPIPPVVSKDMVRFIGYKDHDMETEGAVSRKNAFILERDCRAGMADWERLNWRAVLRYDTGKPDENGVLPPVRLPNDVDLKTHVRGAFCTTEHKAFDLAVTAVLTLVEEMLPGMYTVLSDGFKADWQPAADVLEAALGRPFAIPAGIKEKEIPAA